jgi:hypothetical protein
MLALMLLAPLQEQDPRAKAVREAYEEQLRRDRQQVVIRGRRITLAPLFAPEGLDRLDASQARAFLQNWAEGDHVLSELYASLDGPDLDDARSAVYQLNQLWGRRSPLPRDAASLEIIRRDWEAWRKDPRPACAHTDADVRGLIARMSHDEIDARLEAERALEPCAFLHRALLEDALRGTSDVEAAARLRALSAAIAPGLLGEEGRAVLREALEIFRQSGQEAVAASLRAERARFPGHHAKTLDLLLRALER